MTDTRLRPVASRRGITTLVAALALGLAGCGVSKGAADPASTVAQADGTGADQSVNSTLDEQPAGTDDGATADPEPPAEPEPQPPAAPDPSAEDCVSYNPANLTVTASGDAWLLRDGNHAMKLFDTQADAEDGRRVARNWTKMCFIGRGNQKADRYRYIITYWKDPSGLPVGLAPTFECITYNPATLTIYSGPAHPADPQQDDWALYSGGIPLLFLASQPDALRAKLVAAGNTRLCTIGHGNDRPDPYRYVMEYWRV
jgi:hypothetical protein